jgi:PST family polysaccharide transporter
LKASTQFFLARLSASLYTSSSVVFLGLLGGDATVGYYSAAEKVFLAFQGIYEPVVVSIYPYMSKYRNMGVYRAVFKVSVLFNSLCCVLLFVFSGPLVSLLFGEDFQTSSLILKVFSAALLLVVPSTLLGYPFLAALGFAPCANNSVIAGSLFHLMALVSVCLLVGLNAPLAAGLSVATEAIILTMRAYWVRKHGLWSGGYGQALAGSTCSAVITEGGRQAW